MTIYTDNKTGTAKNDTIKGTAANSKLYGLDGNDVITGNAGDDWLVGGAGNDLIDGGLGDDKISGGADNDRLYGGAGNDVVNGDQGNDWMVGDAGNDTLNGGDGNDKINGGDGNDKINGGNGADILSGDLGADILTGGLGKDIFILTEAVHSSDTVVTSLNIFTPSDTISTLVASTETVTGFVLGEDKLDVQFANIVTDITTKVQGVNPDGEAFGNFAQHTVSKGIYTLYDTNGIEVPITTANENNAYAYMVENTPLNASVAGFHITRAAGVDTIVLQHNHTTATATVPVVENHIVIDLVGVSATGLDSTWII